MEGRAPLRLKRPLEKQDSGKGSVPGSYIHIRIGYNNRAPLKGTGGYISGFL